MKLFDNAITFAIPLLKGEVRIVDQILIEAFRIFYPSVYQAIRHNPDSVLKAAGRLNPREERLPSPVDNAIESLPVGAPEKKALKDLIVDMFPRVGQSGYGDGWDQTWGTEKRICSGDYFERYFTYAVPTGDMADRAVDELVEKAAANDEEGVTAIVESAFDRDAVRQPATLGWPEPAAFPAATGPCGLCICGAALHSFTLRFCALYGVDFYLSPDLCFV